MRAITRLLTVLVLLAALRGATSVLASTLYAIGPDVAMSGPWGFYSVSTGGTIVAGVIRQPSIKPQGGVRQVKQPGSRLVWFSAFGGGSFTNIGLLGQGFVSGLAFNSSDGYLYGISTDWLGASNLNRISLSGAVTPLGVLAPGFYGGLTFRPSDGLLYAFAGDAFGVQREFYSIVPATAGATWLFELGDGSASFNGAWLGASAVTSST